MPAIESPIETPTRTGGRSGSPTSSRRPPNASATAANPGRCDIGPVCPNAGDAGDDEVRVDAVELLGPKAPLLERAGPEVLQQHVAVPDQVEHDRRGRARS